jgi:hypothetical protein
MLFITPPERSVIHADTAHRSTLIVPISNMNYNFIAASGESGDSADTEQYFFHGLPEFFNYIFGLSGLIYGKPQKSC